MGSKTNIEWCDSTWNPIVGCSRVSEGCRNCYADADEEQITDGFDALRFDDGNCEGELGTIDWVICGGESGHGARPMHPEWARDMRRQCVAAGVPFFFKQWGEYATR